MRLLNASDKARIRQLLKQGRSVISLAEEYNTTVTIITIINQSIRPLGHKERTK